MATGLENFAKAENIKIAPELMAQMATLVPPIYFWFDVVNGIPELMTAAVQWKGLNFGLSFPVAENKVKARMDSKKLITHMREVASVLAIHGEKALDSHKELNMKLINEQEAMHWKLDPIWDKRVKAVDKLIRVKDITKQKAQELKLI
jgi:hypothetical protein